MKVQTKASFSLPVRAVVVSSALQWILEVDLRKFFDTVDHRQMQELMCRRVQDGVITRLVAKWLKAGVWEKGDVSYPEEGTPQGGVISPLLSNIYLHEVLGKWFVESVQSACQGKDLHGAICR